MKMKEKIRLLISVMKLVYLSPTAIFLITKVKRNKFTYLSYSKLINLCISVRKVKRKNIQGIFIEAGCALGGSAILISRLKETQRILKIFDTFTQIPPPSSNDEEDAFKRFKIINSGKANGIQKDEYYGYQENLLDKIKRNFKKFDLDQDERNIQFIQGLFDDVLFVSEPVAFAHIDSDWYDSIYTSLERIVPSVSLGGLIVIDDYYDWQGARKATDDFFSDKKDQFQFKPGPQMVIKKIANQI